MEIDWEWIEKYSKTNVDVGEEGKYFDAELAKAVLYLKNELKGVIKK